MSAQEKRILSNSPDTMIVILVARVTMINHMGNIHFAITLREEKPAKKRIRSSLTDRIPQKPV